MVYYITLCTISNRLVLTAGRMEAWTSMGEEMVEASREEEQSSEGEGSSDSEEEWKTLHNYSLPT